MIALNCNKEIPGVDFEKEMGVKAGHCYHCHTGRCPVGVATQNETLRKKFIGTPENVINYFFLVAEEVREIMASLGVKKFDDLIGRSELLCKQAAIDHWKAKDIDLTKILWKPDTKNQKENFHYQ